MKYPSKILEEAVLAISTLPGIGKKSALRMVLHLIQDNNNKSARISSALNLLQEKITTCKHCHMVSDHEECDICKMGSRDNGILCVVESIRDVMAIEDTGQFHGRYHILGGIISPIDGIGPEQLNIGSLIDRVRLNDIKEIIMALSPTIEGDTTIFYLSKRLSETGVSISTIARGVAFGGDLEYADEFTLGKSIMARTPYHNP